uniref:Polypyrimidine tract binding protein 3 n=1 Tax=Athene cunicularia TaxID=194338 RepID=A0A663N5R0_ATHCN
CRDLVPHCFLSFTRTFKNLQSCGMTNKKWTYYLPITTCPSSENKSERQRLPARVLHIFQVPDDATEAEIISLGLPFGKVTNILILRGKKQALLEFDLEESAVNMLRYYGHVLPRLCGHHICIQISHYRELKTDHLRSHTLIVVSAADTDVGAVGGLAQRHTSVLRIIIEKLFCSVTIDTLYQIFSRFGAVLRIVMFTRNNRFQALIEYDDPKNAYSAKICMDGRSIYTTCCILRVDFSKLSKLTVKYNSDKCRDFTRFDLPTDGGQLFLPAAAPGKKPSLLTPPMSGQVTPGATGVLRTSVLLVNNLNPEVSLMGLYGDVQRVKITYKKKETALIQMADEVQAALAIQYLNGHVVYGRAIFITFSKHKTVQLLREGQEDCGLTKDFSDSPLHRFKQPGARNFISICPPSATLHLSNFLPSVSADELKKLFEEAGYTVKAFKFLPKDCSMALVQLDSVEEGICALMELHNHDMGQNYRLSISFSTLTI